jgi:hypothetical protein
LQGSDNEQNNTEGQIRDFGFGFTKRLPRNTTENASSNQKRTKVAKNIPEDPTKQMARGWTMFILAWFIPFPENLRSLEPEGETRRQALTHARNGQKMPLQVGDF